MRISIKGNLKWVIAIFTGLAVTAGSFFFLNGKFAQANNQETISLPVPKHNMEVYEVISPDDLTWKDYPKGTNLAGVVKTPDEAAGMMVISPLYKGVQIKRESLSSDNNVFDGRYAVYINIDEVRAAGVKPGDTVDVYWVPSDSTASTGAIGSKIIARNAQVISVGSPEGALQSKTTRYVQLAITPKEAPAVATGARPGDTHLVLIRKPNGPDQNVVSQLNPRPEGDDRESAVSQETPRTGSTGN